ncbi:MAG: hypothetical protein H0T46_05805 [Deltaproteobacteria bacterium]|nr:hypothetical protein [Deltaproteobacteria bacterium]
MRRGRLFAVSIVCAAACAAAGKDNGNGGDPIDAPTGGGDPDSGGGGMDSSVTTDAPMADAAPVTITLTQNTGTSIGSNNSIACGNPDGTTAENSWYRVFRLADHGVVGGLRVTAVSFGVQEALGLPNVQIKIGTYSGNLVPPPAQLDTGLITPLTSATFAVPNTANTAPTSVTVPITANVPALSQMIVEIFSPDMNGTSKYFYLGGNATGESKPGYLRAPTGACATPQPRSTTALGFPTSHLFITVAGTH